MLRSPQTDEGRGLALQVEGLRLSYPMADGRELAVLDIPAWRLPAGAAIGIAGASGSGKTSLLHLLAGIERPTAGRVRWGGTDITALSESARDRWRRLHVGLVFQEFHLIPGMSAEDNVLMPAWLDHVRAPGRLKARAAELIAQVGLTDQRRQPVARMSRGQQQRVALARALLRDPAIILADEPTASLDRDGAGRVGNLLLDLAAHSGATLIVISHDQDLLARLPRQVKLEAGRSLAP